MLRNERLGADGVGEELRYILAEKCQRPGKDYPATRKDPPQEKPGQQSF